MSVLFGVTELYVGFVSGEFDHILNLIKKLHRFRVWCCIGFNRRRLLAAVGYELAKWEGVV